MDAPGNRRLRVPRKSSAHKLTSDELVERLAQFEREHGLSSQEFYARFRSGEAGDSPQVMAWAGLCYMATRCGLLAEPPVRA